MSMAKGSPNSVEQTNGNCQQINKHIDQCFLLFIQTNIIVKCKMFYFKVVFIDI